MASKITFHVASKSSFLLAIVTQAPSHAGSKNVKHGRPTLRKYIVAISLQLTN